MVLPADDADPQIASVLRQTVGGLGGTSTQTV
jgi:hypothetical protein